MNIYKVRLLEYNHSRVGIRNVYYAVTRSAAAYIPNNKRDKSTREIIQSLRTKFERPDEELMIEISERYASLRGSAPVRNRVEMFVSDWEKLREEIDECGLTLSFHEVLYTKDFLKAGRRFAPLFCDTWAQSKRAAGKTLSFFKTAMEYRLAAEAYGKDGAAGTANAATLQGFPQVGSDSTTSNSTSKPTRKDRYKNTPCLCGEIHMYNACPYLIVKNRGAGWKSDRKVHDKIRTELSKNLSKFNIVKKLSNTVILNGIVPPPPRVDPNRSESAKNESELEGHTAFQYSTMALANSTSNNLLRNSVIYDGGCSMHMTWDSSRFIGPITPAYEWIQTVAGDLRILGYGTMRVRGQVNGKATKLDFDRVAFVPDSNVTLISESTLKNDFNALWDMTGDCVIMNGKRVFDLEETMGVYLIEHNPMGIMEVGMANYVAPRIVPPASP